MKFEQVCQSMNTYFSQNRIGRVMLPVSVPVLLVCAVLSVVADFISLGSIVNTLVYILFFFALILVLSCCNFRMAAIGMGIFALDYLYGFLYSLIKYRAVNYSSLIYVLLYAFFIYQAYRKSLQINK